MCFSCVRHYDAFRVKEGKIWTRSMSSVIVRIKPGFHIERFSNECRK